MEEQLGLKHSTGLLRQLEFGAERDQKLGESGTKTREEEHGGTEANNRRDTKPNTRLPYAKTA